tara:strand:- start:274 stop:402 length:129 start_codon:yes stop_codon:yes gene_type:complete
MRGEMVSRSLAKEVIRKRPKGPIFGLFNPWPNRVSTPIHMGI